MSHAKLSILLLTLIFASITTFNVSGAKYKCDKECKKQELMQKGLPKLIVEPLVEYCKKTARDPVHCIKWGASVIANESSNGTRCHNKNCTGLYGGNKSYRTYRDGVEDWVNRYNKYWYKAKNSFFFYGDRGKLGKSHYCTSEVSSKSKVGCPNGNKNAKAFFISLSF